MVGGAVLLVVGCEGIYLAEGFCLVNAGTHRGRINPEVADRGHGAAAVDVVLHMDIVLGRTVDEHCGIAVDETGGGGQGVGHGQRIVVTTCGAIVSFDSGAVGLAVGDVGVAGAAGQLGVGDVVAFADEVGFEGLLAAAATEDVAFERAVTHGAVAAYAAAGDGDRGGVVDMAVEAAAEDVTHDMLGAIGSFGRDVGQCRVGVVDDDLGIVDEGEAGPVVAIVYVDT